jgi:1-acyl-sn-glycerol-3-phosphate acyltransferase
MAGRVTPEFMFQRVCRSVLRLAHGASQVRILTNVTAAGDTRKGHPAQPSASEACGNLFIANRATALDTLAIAAAFPGKVAFAGEAALDGLPWSLKFLLKPLVISRKEDLRLALANGRAVVAFPESRAGEPPSRCRYRLALFQHSVPLRPLGIDHGSEGWDLCIGESLPARGDPGAAGRREEARAALARLCQMRGANHDRDVAAVCSSAD